MDRRRVGAEFPYGHTIPRSARPASARPGGFARRLSRAPKRRRPGRCIATPSSGVMGDHRVSDAGGGEDRPGRVQPKPPEPRERPGGGSLHFHDEPFDGGVAEVAHLVPRPPAPDDIARLVGISSPSCPAVPRARRPCLRGRATRARSFRAVVLEHDAFFAPGPPSPVLRRPQCCGGGSAAGRERFR